MNKDDCRALFSQAKLHFNEGSYREAADAFGQIALPGLTFEDKALVFHYLALCSSFLEHFSDSLDYFERAKKEEPESALISFNQGLTYYFLASRQKKPRLYLKMALHCFNDALAKEATNPEFWYYRGYMHALLDNTDKAIYCFERVFSLAQCFENKELCELYEEMYVRKNLSAKKLPDHIQRE